MIKFYGYFRSSAAYRCRIAFNLKKVEYDFEQIHLRHGDQKKPEFLAMNPQGLVPAVTDGNTTITQSMAIIEWLDETHGEPILLSDDADTRAQIRAFSQLISCDIHPLQNLRVLQYLKKEFDADQKTLDEWCGRWIKDGLTAAEELLRTRENSRFCFGDKPTLADICLVPQVFSAHRFGVDISGLTRIQEVIKNCEEMTEFQSAHPKNQPDWEA